MKSSRRFPEAPFSESTAFPLHIRPSLRPIVARGSPYCTCMYKRKRKTWGGIISAETKEKGETRLSPANSSPKIQDPGLVIIAFVIMVEPQSSRSIQNALPALISLPSPTELAPSLSRSLPHPTSVELPFPALPVRASADSSTLNSIFLSIPPFRPPLPRSLPRGTSSDSPLPVLVLPLRRRP